MEQDSSDAISADSYQMHDLPPEILGWIFQLTALDKEGYTIRDQVLALCLVCKGWYEAALLEHHLWGRIVISKANNKLQSYEKVMAWLNRSPASLRALKAGYDAGNLSRFSCDCFEALQDTTTYTPTACDYDFSVVSQLVTNTLALGHLDLAMRTLVCLHRFCEVISLDKRSNAWDNLSSLKIKVVGQCLDDSPRIRPLRHLPPLQSLELDLSGATSRYDASSGNGDNPLRIDILPSTLLGLSSFSFALPPYCAKDVLNILSHCVNLERLTIDFSWNGAIESAICTTTFPRLQTLTVRSVLHSTASRALRFLHAPTLSNLIICARDYSSAPAKEKRTHTLLELIESLSISTNTPSTLLSLTLYGTKERSVAEIDPVKLVNILSTLPNLRRLSLNAINFNAKEFLDLSRQQPAGFASALESLELWKIYHGFGLNYLLEFVLDLAQRAEGSSAGIRPAFRALAIYDFSAGYNQRIRAAYNASPVIPELRAMYGVSVERYGE